MLVSIDHSSPTPLHAQLTAALRHAIADGHTRPGDTLPAAGDLAASLHLNKNTVLRAYRSLRDEGVLELRRGRGAIVIGLPRRTDAVENALDHLAELAKEHDTSLSTITAGLTIRGLN
ncbi:GntR family transcriptional regulator [Corynebacterium sp. TAE3-ERU12]|uniref:GntR family transcriptional regulator n=1 Tax=Corynebacterium sp. TAE3-ERU12 TaxID=2849491 RepID=UPI001C43BC1B|nr:GntR family transcriptional regulator [Corynebacterium sp. TAE3-ERU12]MBV7295214.1 GntR family transcriptional regulator [Corynebacterium sp. TAE3-ERU12]